MMKMQKFSELSKKERKNFLSNDLKERIIRIEQRISARFGKIVFYQETNYYKSLTDAEKRDFEKYLKNKKKKKYYAIFIFLMPILLLFSLNLEFTGNAIRDNLGSTGFSALKTIFIIVFILIILIIFTGLRTKKFRNKKFEGCFRIIENIYHR